MRPARVCQPWQRVAPSGLQLVLRSVVSPFTRWHAEHKQVVSSRQGPGTLRVSGTIKLLSAKPHTVAAPEVHELLARHLARETANLVVPEAKQEMNTFTGAQLAPGK